MGLTIRSVELVSAEREKKMKSEGFPVCFDAPVTVAVCFPGKKSFGPFLCIFMVDCVCSFFFFFFEQGVTRLESDAGIMRG